MNALLVVALVVPLAGALVTSLLPARAWITPAVAGASALAWVVLAAAEPAPEVGRIVASPLVAAAVVGVALLVAARPPGAALARSAGLCGIAVLAVAASTGDGGLPDRPLAAGVLVLGMLVSLGVRIEGATLPIALAPTLAGSVTGVGLLFGDADRAATLVAVGAGGIALLTFVRWSAGGLLLPVVVLASARAADLAHEVGDSSTRVAATAAAMGAVTLAALVLGGRRPGTGISEHHLPRACVAAALVVLVQDLPDLRAAGLLLAAGGILAVAAAHPMAVVACLPGLAAAVAGFGPASEPVHAAAGAVAAGLVIAGGALDAARPVAPVPRYGVRGVEPWALAAAAFAVAPPLWGWSGADLDDYVAAVGPAAATFLLVTVALVAMSRAPRPAEGGVHEDLPGPIGRLRRRPRAVDHGSTDPLVDEEDGPLEGVAPAATRAATVGRRRSEPPVAAPARAVPRRSGPGGVGGRGRLRARPGRPPG